MVEVSVIKQVVLVPLIALDALEPALDAVHGSEHGGEIVVDGGEAAECGA